MKKPVKWNNGIVGSGLTLLMSVLFVACEDVINLDVSDVEPQLFIEGVISSSSSASKVTIGFTQNAYTSSSARSVAGARIIVSDDAGNSEVLKQSAPGVFVPSAIIGEPGRKYFLNVKVDGKEYAATSTMPAAMSLDSVRNVSSTSWFIFTTSILKYYITNRPGIEEYCLIKAYNPGSSSFVWTIYSDKYTDGRQVDLVSPEFTPTTNTINVEIISIDKATYEYFYSVKEILGNGNLSLPDLLGMDDFNPKSNLTDNALGYFSAQSRVVYSVPVR
jgi:hypothetical protein